MHADMRTLLARLALCALLGLACTRTPEPPSSFPAALDATALQRQFGCIDSLTVPGPGGRFQALVFDDGQGGMTVRIYKQDGDTFRQHGPTHSLTTFERPLLRTEAGTPLLVARDKRLGVLFRFDITPADVQFVPHDARVGPAQRVK